MPYQKSKEVSEQIPELTVSGTETGDFGVYFCSPHCQIEKTENFINLYINFVVVNEMNKILYLSIFYVTICLILMLLISAETVLK